MKFRKSAGIIAFLLTAAMIFTLTSCGADKSSAGDTGAAIAANGVDSGAARGLGIDEDREGNPIALPPKIEKVIAMGPSNTEILIALGCGDAIIAADAYSGNVEGLKAGIPLFDMKASDGERIINLQPDVMFVTGMSKAGGDDPFKVVADAGICVIYIPSSMRIDAIKEDIRYIAAVMGASGAGEEIVAEMEKEIGAIREAGKKVTEPKTVYFEIDAPPHLYSFGQDVFLNEMIELIGARNIFGDSKESWLSVSDEAIVSADPDVILTSVNYIDRPVEDIKTRPGWAGITAVKNGDVYYIDTDASNRPSHNIVKALKEMAEAIYPGTRFPVERK